MDRLQNVLLLADRGPAARADRALVTAERTAWESDAAREGGPTLELSSEGQWDERQANAVDTVRYSQPIATLRQRTASDDLRESATAWEDTALASQRASLLSNAARAWVELSTTVASIELEAAAIERTRSTLERFRRRLELGEIAGSEVRQLEAAERAGRSRVTLLEVERTRQHRALEGLLGQETELPAGEDLDQLASRLLSSPAAVEAPLAQRRSRAYGDLRLAEAALQESRAAGTPEIGVEYEHVPPLFGAPTGDGVGVSVSVPLPFGRAYRQRRSAAQKAARAAEATAELDRQQLASRIEAVRSELAALRAALDELEPALEDLAIGERSLIEQVRLGAISYLVFLDGSERLDGVRRAAIDLRREALIRQIDWYRLTGDPQALPVAADDSGDSP